VCNDFDMKNQFKIFLCVLEALEKEKVSGAFYWRVLVAKFLPTLQSH
jgi:hypothetical protein